MEFIILATTHFLALLSPGPDFFLIMQASIRMKLRYAVSICGGISFANGVYLLCAILGIETIKSNQTIMQLLQYGGALYLIFLGVMLLKIKKNQEIELPKSKLFLHVESIPRQFFIGFLSGILNPKNMLFYFSIFTVLVSEQTLFSTKVLYALWMVAIVFSWDCLVAMLFGKNSLKKYFERSIYYIEKITGLALVLFGSSLIFF